MTLVRLIARPMLSSMFIMGGINALKNPDQMAQRAKPVIDRLQPLLQRATGPSPIDLDPKRVVQINALVDIGAGAALATGRWPRISALVLAVSLLPTTFGGHRYWEEDDGQSRSNQKVHFTKNLSILGGLLLASVDTEGRPSLAWQARRQASKAKKKASQLTG
jgi:putative oxidoreductase